MQRGAPEAFVNPADAATPKRLCATQYQIQCKYLLVKGIKSSRTNNTGTVYIGVVSDNDSQQIDVPTGTERELVAFPGQLIDLYDIFVDIVSAGDGIWYQATGLAKAAS